MAKFNFSANLINYASVITLTSFIIVIIMAIVFFWPGFQDLEFIQKKIGEKRLELQRKEEYLLKLHQIKAQLEEREEDFAKIKSALPDDSSLPSLLNYLQKTSSESGLILEKIAPFTVSSSKDLPGLQETVFGIELVGSYSSLKDFLSIIEKSARLIEVESISFSSKEGEEVFTFSLKIKVFSY